MENTSDDKKVYLWAGRESEYQKEYQLKYYHKTKGQKRLSECGLWHDKYRVSLHLKTKKHIKHLNLKKENLENLEKIKNIE